MNKLTSEQKAVVATSLLPLLADMLEDMPKFKRVKMLSNQLIEEIRKQDVDILKNADTEGIEFSTNLQILVMKVVSDVFKGIGYSEEELIDWQLRMKDENEKLKK
jgi:predicted house-cleaning noncanonical NTP pyrophosphatase (MazG superfamily)